MTQTQLQSQIKMSKIKDLTKDKIIYETEFKKSFDDKKIMMLRIVTDWQAGIFMSDRLKDDEEMILHACKQNINALKYASKRLQIKLNGVFFC